MISYRQIERTLKKLSRFETMLEDYLFVRVDEIDMRWYQTSERLHEVPLESLFTACSIGGEWGGEGTYCWFRGVYIPPQELKGRRLYLYPKSSCGEGMLWLNGQPSGVFTARKPPDRSRGNHYCDLLTLGADPESPIDVALELYAGHYCAGTSPFSDESRSYRFTVGSADVCVRDELVADVLFDLKVVNRIALALDEQSFRRADVLNALLAVHEVIYYDPENADQESFREGLRLASPILKRILNSKNSVSAPFTGLIGHSHMDTAWLWTIDETVKKCARTYSNQISLMEQYPEYMFVQSSAYHSEMIRRHYPDLFKRIQEKVSEGRYEPNGGVWVECDCNIVSGESLVRQFLWGQRYTREHFGYTADVFWLPDTFGYNPAIPQIMKKSRIDYFLTTKMSWNDTNKFPYDTFYWKGIDGTCVLTHLNQSHLWPDPVNLMEYMVTGKRTGDCVREKTVSRQKLFSFGYGDGGGGPQFEMLEVARRVGDVDGLPRTGYTTVSDFMKDLEKNLNRPSTYAGELYLELHRGTLTNQHQIKRNNRLAEITLHDLEYLTVRDAIERGENPDGGPIRGMTETLLVNQFHDILPGTCIPEVHEHSVSETSKLIKQARDRCAKLMADNKAGCVTVANTLSFARSDILYLDVPEGLSVPGMVCQPTDTLIDGYRLAVAGAVLEPFSARTLELAAGKTQGEEERIPFILSGNKLETPFAIVTFTGNGTIESFLDKSARNRELCGNGYPLNTFLIAEDVPLSYDNWDVDADIEYKLRPCSNLLEREIVSQGQVELRIRSKYRLTSKSTLLQDIVFYADSPLVSFETRIDWQDHHRFLKTAFDTSIQTDEARHEIQFGHVKRSTSRSTDIEKAKFEVSNHKFTDLSESRYGIALLNDCKYGISVYEGQMRLSLHKGGNRPDYNGDVGLHFCRYAFLPHNGAFSAETVVRPAYMYNYRHVEGIGAHPQETLMIISADNIIVETVKPCEDVTNGYVARLYECEGARTAVTVRVPGAMCVTESNLLEEPIGEAAPGGEIELVFHPFEIKTLIVGMGG